MIFIGLAKSKKQFNVMFRSSPNSLRYLTATEIIRLFKIILKDNCVLSSLRIGKVHIRSKHY